MPSGLVLCPILITVPPLKVRGLKHLHACGIIHKDIKPSNILISQEGHCIISDFGACVFVPEGGRGILSQDQGAFTDYYAAPELLKEYDQGTFWYTYAVDYWALAVTICEVILDRDLPKEVAKEYSHERRHPCYPRIPLDRLVRKQTHIRVALEIAGCPENITHMLLRVSRVFRTQNALY